jgi:NO-binding membrane sensor protein with MHYT domain
MAICQAVGKEAVPAGRWTVWLMHFIAMLDMLGFAIPDSVVRYHLGWTIASAVLATSAVFIGLITIGRTVKVGRLIAALSIVIGVLAATAALRFVGGIGATVAGR